MISQIILRERKTMETIKNLNTYIYEIKDHIGY